MDEFFARNRLSAYIDGELSDAEMAEVARAIEEQPEVREAYQELKAAVELLRRHGPVQAPAGFHRGVMQRVEGLSSGRGWFARLLGPLGRYPVQGLGVAVVAAAVMLLVFRGPMLQDESSAGHDQPATADGTQVPEREAAVPGPVEGEGAEQGRAGEPAPAQKQAPADEQSGSATQAAASASTTGGESSGKASPKSTLGTKGREAGAKTVPIEEFLQKEEGTYIPDWDKENAAPTATLQPSEPDAAQVPEGGSGDLATSPFTYRLTPDQPDALRRLVALAEKLGGGLYTTSGEPFDPYILTVERNYAKVVLRIPASRLDSVESYLKGMGGLVAVHADQDRLFAADSVHVAVEVQYQP